MDHRVPLFRVWNEHRNMPWPKMLDFWGWPSLQVVNCDAHFHKVRPRGAGPTSRTLAERLSWRRGRMSAFGGKADIPDVRYSPRKQTLGFSRVMSAVCQKRTLAGRLVDQFVSYGNQTRRQFKLGVLVASD